jgi:hypothetical protein
MASRTLLPTAPPRRWLRVPWSPRAWSRTLFLLGAVPVQLAALAALVWPWPLGPKRFEVVLLALIVPVATVYVIFPVLSNAHRHRLRTTAGVDIPAPPGVPDRWRGPGIIATLRARATWRQLAYHVLVAPLLALASLVTAGVWLAGGVAAPTR